MTTGLPSHGAREVSAPFAGPHNPLASTPARVPGGVRRTSVLDTTRPEGIHGVSLMHCSARDILTAADGSVIVLGEVSLGAAVDPERRLTSIDSGFDALVGARVSGGFRGKLAAVDAGSLTLTILDDFPNANLVSHYAEQRADDSFSKMSDRAAEHMDSVADVCAGWARTGSIFVLIHKYGGIPTPYGPPAPVLEAADPAGWQPIAVMPPYGMRRRRSLDLLPSGEFFAHFRDSHHDAAGLETVVHEYVVAGTVETATGTVTGIEAQARVLPWIECPAALASAQRMVGEPVADLRSTVGSNFLGVSTCTHLNDVLRNLADLEPLRVNMATAIR